MARICAVITANDPEAIREVEPLADLFEVRIDLIGERWQALAKTLRKPWIACNRRAEEGGNWAGNETERVIELLKAPYLGASIVDIELATKGLEETVKKIKAKAECLISCHDLKETPALGKLGKIVDKELAAGADICKVVTTATKFEDNMAVLQLIADFAENRIVSFAMGPLGHTSRVLCPLIGGDFTYASIATGKESAPGQITVKELKTVYGMIEHGK